MKYKITTRTGKQYIVTVRDMALSRTDAMDRCISLGQKFIEHFDKLYKNPDDSSKTHWLIEMESWYKKVKQIKLKQNHSPLTNSELHDWFFTAGANSIDFMKNGTRTEEQFYDKFVTKIISGNTINQFWESICDEV